MDEPRQQSDRFDAFALVARQGHLEGAVDPFDLDRVQDSLGDEDGEIPPARVAYRLEGETDALGRAVLNLTLDGEVPLQCQRCMRLFSWPVHQRTQLLLAHDEQELSYLDDNDEREVLLAAGPLDPVQVVEDELVLTLPYVPRCDRPDCVADAAGEIVEERPKPFDALGALKGERNRKQ
ncbi:MAG TPA: YceD family protein [Casimicrobiaceae bacterium]|nr:YceD family protein [Casimicrobiaceae bacterium]